jgi:deazaflavin-dependent oxidoreductase (nitroreductase family)
VDAAALDAEPYCYLTTTGRTTGDPHEIEIWFTAIGRSLYLISGGLDGSDWVKNLVARPLASVRVGASTYPVSGRVPVHPGEERTTAVAHLYRKYGDQVSGSLDDWQRDGFIVALDTAPDLR